LLLTHCTRRPRNSFWVGIIQITQMVIPKLILPTQAAINTHSVISNITYDISNSGFGGSSYIFIDIEEVEEVEADKICAINLTTWNYQSSVQRNPFYPVSSNRKFKPCSFPVSLYTLPAFFS
ncbi:hypothetical protein PanWU01x14_081240, partial [Parasponia andersonii]